MAPALALFFLGGIVDDYILLNDAGHLSRCDNFARIWKLAVHVSPGNPIMLSGLTIDSQSWHICAVGMTIRPKVGWLSISRAHLES